MAVKLQSQMGISLTTALLAALLTIAAGCGMVTHNLIAERARQWFLDSEQPGVGGAMVARHLDALQGGAPFPVRPVSVSREEGSLVRYRMVRACHLCFVSG